MVVRSLRCWVRVAVVLLVLGGASLASAKADNWIRLQSPRFGIVSQLSEKETRTWADEFDKFITALHQLYNVEDDSLVPLTIILFKNRKQFKPYCSTPDRRKAKNIVGLFANRDDWSVIGLPGLKDFQKTRRTILHEAVHWYMHSRNFKAPLWVEEGIAEVFSTFEVRNGKGRWGLAIQSHIDYLNYKRMQSTREFLLAGQDEALNEIDTYYPQAWAMVHYFMFGNGGRNMEKFSLFLSGMSRQSTERSFESAFGITYEEFDRDLQGYIRGGKYMIGEVELTDNAVEMKTGPASNAMVQFALGRLAVGTGNYDIGIRHAEAVVSSVPSNPEGYELMAMASAGNKDETRLLDALEKAVRFNSRDPQVYLMQASALHRENWKRSAALDKGLEKDLARRIADLFIKSTSLQPPGRTDFEGFAVALLNLETYTDEDRRVLELGKRRFPEEGAVLAGLAALARMDGDIDAFNRLLETAYGDDMRLPMDLKMGLRGMQQAAYYDWFMEVLPPLLQRGDFESAEALYEAQRAQAYESKDLQKILDSMDVMLYSARRLHSAETAMKARRLDEAAEILEDIEKDEKIPRHGKNAARRMKSVIERAKGAR